MTNYDGKQYLDLESCIGHAAVAKPHIWKLLATSTRNEPARHCQIINQQCAGHTLESKDQENVQRAFGAIRVPLWWCEYYGATLSKSPALPSPLTLAFRRRYVSGEQGYSLWEVLVCRHGMTRSTRILGQRLSPCRDVLTSGEQEHGVLSGAVSVELGCSGGCTGRFNTWDGCNGVTDIPHGVLGGNVCAAAIYRHPASVMLLFQLSLLLLLGAHKGSTSAVDGAGYILQLEVARENERIGDSASAATGWQWDLWIHMGPSFQLVNHENPCLASLPFLVSFLLFREIPSRYYAHSSPNRTWQSQAVSPNVQSITLLLRVIDGMLVLRAMMMRSSP
ncbi:hypothetical protein EV421DRAFT_2018969 [Armillaria borealis]|uniref:Uncharacterized protein n=1 Tax=Armillaria borealis TaxID=47425 RepID=A0AA39MRS1_9AGAR|nr:hypothetical protein EV421DRAFT_2018969 [Armillaria borealis]